MNKVFYCNAPMPSPIYVLFGVAVLSYHAQPAHYIGAPLLTACCDRDITKSLRDIMGVDALAPSAVRPSATTLFIVQNKRVFFVPGKDCD